MTEKINNKQQLIENRMKMIDLLTEQINTLPNGLELEITKLNLKHNIASLNYLKKKINLQI
jgi:hypothetical protein